MVAYRIAQLTVCLAARIVWRVRVRDAGRMPAGAVIVVGNHESYLDPIVLGGAFRRPIRFLTKDDFFRGRLAWLFRSLGGIPVARGRGDREAVAAGVRALEAGHAVGVFPQGTVLGGPDRPWLRGAARLALSTGAPILPVSILHTERALRPVHRTIGFPRIEVRVGEPIRVERGPLTVAAARALTQQLRDTVEGLRHPDPPPLATHRAADTSEPVASDPS